uniref:NME/NM23 family member 5 n=1 Tax=Sphaeramia orbicularis TaxID=375764 RepID=A0A673AZ60_9TELE
MEQTNCRRVYVERTLALIKPDAIHKTEEIEDIILKSGFTILQHKPFNPCIWLADWLMKHNPNKPQVCDGVIVEDAE